MPAIGLPVASEKWAKNWNCCCASTEPRRERHDTEPRRPDDRTTLPRITSPPLAWPHLHGAREPCCYSSMMPSSTRARLSAHRSRRGAAGAARCAGACARPATSRSPTATRCLPRWPTACRRSPATPPAPTAAPRSSACAASASSIEETGARCRRAAAAHHRARAAAACSAPAGVLDAGNSGTTIRMLAGVLAAHPFAATHDRRRVAAQPADAAHHRARSSAWARASSPTTAARR